jgi:uncharacterized protein (TIGR04255 family)
MDKQANSLIHYENPPVTEVVIGVLFEPINSLLIPHFGILWEKYRSEYSDCREVPPLPPIIETFEEGQLPPKSIIEFSDLPPLPRIWFVHNSKNRIIQVQRDRFLHNWKKADPKDEYPRYYSVYERFLTHCSQFESFLEENKLGKIVPLQFEMTYVNHIPQGEGWKSLAEIASLLPDFAYRNIKGRFFPNPENINWRTAFALPKNAGRMHVNIRNGTHIETRQATLILELTVRGIGTDRSKAGMKEWFDLAHQWIVYGFADLTDEEVQKKIWKREA